MQKDFIDPDFKTTTYYGMKSLSEDQILNFLKSDYRIYVTFNQKGIIHSNEYPFITKVTFSEKEKNCVENSKTEKEKEQAICNLKVVEEYFNNLNQSKSYELIFAARNDDECAILDYNRFGNNYVIQQKLGEIFG